MLSKKYASLAQFFISFFFDLANEKDKHLFHTFSKEHTDIFFTRIARASWRIKHWCISTTKMVVYIHNVIVVNCCAPKMSKIICRKKNSLYHQDCYDFFYVMAFALFLYHYCYGLLFAGFKAFESICERFQSKKNGIGQIKRYFFSIKCVTHKMCL